VGCGQQNRGRLLPSGKQIADRYGRHERWGRLTKRAGTAGELSHHGPDTRLMNLRRSDERLCGELPDRRGQQLIGHDREGGQLG